MWIDTQDEYDVLLDYYKKTFGASTDKQIWVILAYS